MKLVRKSNKRVMALLVIGVSLVGCSRSDKSLLEDNQIEKIQNGVEESERIQPYSDIKYDQIVEDPNSLTVLVNKERRLPDGYQPEDLVVPNVRFSYGGVCEKSYMREVAAEALEELFYLAEMDGIILYAVSGYRSYDRQVEVYNDYVVAMGEEEANILSAQAGFSEHQTGLAMDVSSTSSGYDLVESFIDTAEGTWLAENAHRAGFIIRYLEGKTDITGYSYEPWHLRYVGVEIAETIYQQGITLEEYLESE